MVSAVADGFKTSILAVRKEVKNDFRKKQLEAAKEILKEIKAETMLGYVGIC